MMDQNRKEWIGERINALENYFLDNDRSRVRIVKKIKADLSMQGYANPDVKPLGIWIDSLTKIATAEYDITHRTVHDNSQLEEAVTRAAKTLLPQKIAEVTDRADNIIEYFDQNTKARDQLDRILQTIVRTRNIPGGYFGAFNAAIIKLASAEISTCAFTAPEKLADAVLTAAKKLPVAKVRTASGQGI